MGQLVTINDWASGPNGFKEPISRAALHKIAKTKQTYPPAIKQGRRWVVDISSGISDTARLLVEKALNGCSPKKA